MPAFIISQAETAGGSPHSSRAAWATSTAFYVVPLATTTYRLHIIGSTNGSTWTELDGANIPLGNFELPYSSWLHTDGFIYAFYAPIFPGTYRVRRFDTSTDTWETSDYTGVDVSVNVGDQASVRIVLTSNNEIICFYQDINTLEPTYRRWDGAAWSAETSIAAVDGRPLDAIVDGSDRVVLYYANATANKTQAVTLDMGSTLGTITDIDATANATSRWSAHVCRFNDGTDDRIGLLSYSSGGTVDCYSGTEGATLGSLTTTTGLSTSTVNPGNIALTFFGGNLYTCWSDDTDFHTVGSAVSTSLTPPTFDPELAYTPSGGIVSAPQWISGLGALGFCYQLNNEVSGLQEVWVEWLIQPEGYQPWPANDISQLVTASTRE